MSALEIRAVWDGSLAGLREALAAASELDLDAETREILRQRLGGVVDGLGDLIVYGDIRATTVAGQFDLPLRLDLGRRDRDLVAALRARDVDGLLRHLDSPAGGGDEPTVGPAGCGVKPRPAVGADGGMSAVVPNPRAYLTAEECRRLEEADPPPFQQPSAGSAHWFQFLDRLRRAAGPFYKRRPSC